jgi:DNA-binding transcriptional regulator YiaG
LELVLIATRRQAKNCYYHYLSGAKRQNGLYVFKEEQAMIDDPAASDHDDEKMIGAEPMTGLEFRDSLKAMNLSQLEFSKFIGVQKWTISKWATDARPIPRHISVLAALMSVTNTWRDSYDWRYWDLVKFRRRKRENAEADRSQLRAKIAENINNVM